MRPKTSTLGASDLNGKGKSFSSSRQERIGIRGQNNAQPGHPTSSLTHSSGQQSVPQVQIPQRRPLQSAIESSLSGTLVGEPAATVSSAENDRGKGCEKDKQSVRPHEM